jgi:hypothetical protein
MSLTCVFSVVGASAVAGGLAFPALLSTIGVVLLFVGFAICFGSIVALTVSSPFSRKNRRPPQPVPPRLFTILFATGLAGGVSGVIGLVRSRGFGANPSTPSCDWPISKDHGSTVRCVSHSRWLVVHHGVETGILGFLVVFAAVLCGVIAARTTKAVQVVPAADATST